MIKSNIQNRKLKNGILFTDLCTKDFCNIQNNSGSSRQIIFLKDIFNVLLEFKDI